MIRIQVKINDALHRLETDNSTFTQTLLNPAFTNEAIWNVHSYPFTLPNTDANAVVFKMIEHPASTSVFDDLKDLDCIVFDDEVPVIYGKLSVTEAGSDAFEITVNANSNTLVSIKDKKLKEIDFGELIDMKTQYQSLELGITGITAGNLGVFIWGTQYYTPFNTDIETTVNDLVNVINTTGPGDVSAYYTLVWAGAFYDAIVIIHTTIGALPVFDAAPGSHGTNGQWIYINLTKSWQIAYAQLESYMTNAATVGSSGYPCAFFPVLNQEPQVMDPDDTTQALEEMWQNPWSRQYDSFYMNIADSDSAFKSCASPFPYAFNILHRIAELISAKWDYESEDYSDFNYIVTNLCLYSNASIEVDEYDPEVTTWDNTMSIMGQEFDLKNFMPDRTVQEFINALTTLFNAAVYWNAANSKFRYVLKDKILSDNNYEDLTAFAAPYLVVRINEDYSTYTMRYNWDGGDNYISGVVRDIFGLEVVSVYEYSNLPTTYVAGTIYYVETFRRYYVPVMAWPPGPVTFTEFSIDLCPQHGSTSKENVYEVAPECDTLAVYTKNPWEANDAHLSPRIYPVTRYPIMSHATSQPADLLPKQNEIGLRFMLYHGRIDDDANPGLTYPYGSSHEYDNLGNQIADHNLVWNRPANNEHCLWPKYHQAWYEFLRKSKEVEMQLALNSLQIHNLSLEKKVMIHGIKYLIKEIQVEYPITKPVAVKLVPVR